MATPAKGAICPEDSSSDCGQEDAGAWVVRVWKREPQSPLSRHQLCPLAGPQFGDGVPPSGNRGECCASRSSWREMPAVVGVGASRIHRGSRPSTICGLRLVAAGGGFSITPRVPFSFVVCRVLGRSISPFRFAVHAAAGEDSDTRGAQPRWVRATRGIVTWVLAACVKRQTGGACS